MKIGGIRLKNNILLAPLAGVTDVGFRSIAADYGAGLTYTEMVSGKGLLYGSKNTAELLITEENEKPCAVQLFGAEPEVIYSAVQNPLLKKFDIIDINMGCPVLKVTRCGEGSALLKNIPLAREIIAAAVEAGNKPVTVKFRTGWDDDSIVAAEFAKMCENAGASAITVHGRTRKQLYGGNANYEHIKDAVRAVNIPVFANGDIRTHEDVLRVLEYTGAAGVMIGRAAMGKPYIFAELLGKNIEVDICAIIVKHMDLLFKNGFSDKLIALNMRKHVSWYFKGCKGGKEICGQVNKASTTSEIKEIISQSQASM